MVEMRMVSATGIVLALKTLVPSTDSMMASTLLGQLTETDLVLKNSVTSMDVTLLDSSRVTWKDCLKVFWKENRLAGLLLETCLDDSMATELGGR